VSKLALIACGSNTDDVLDREDELLDEDDVRKLSLDEDELDENTSELLLLENATELLEELDELDENPTDDDELENANEELLDENATLDDEDDRSSPMYISSIYITCNGLPGEVW